MKYVQHVFGVSRRLYAYEVCTLLFPMVLDLLQRMDSRLSGRSLVWLTTELVNSMLY